MTKEPKYQEREVKNLLDEMDQDLAIYIHAHADRVFDEYQKLGEHLGKMDMIRKGDIAKHYRKLFGSQKVRPGKLNFVAVSYLINHFNGPNSINSPEELKTMAKQVAGEAVMELNEPITTEIQKDIHRQVNEIDNDEIVDLINSGENW